MKHEIPEINAGSMADIAFLLLIFFLVTTTLSTDLGIPRILPPKADSHITPPKTKDRNILVVLVNREDKIMVDGEPLKIDQLKESAKLFIDNTYNDISLPEKEIKYIEGIGNWPVSKQIISLQSDKGTSYGKYIRVQNEITAAYNELRESIAVERFGQPFTQLNEIQLKAVKRIYPMRISEAAPN